MPEPICPHTPGMPVRSCGLCLDEGNFSAAPRPAARARPKYATSDGSECVYCHAGIHKGELTIATQNGIVHHRHIGGTRP